MSTTIGQCIKDGFKTTDNWVTNGIKWLDDIQEYYRERSLIEKEYGTKLQALAKKYQEKRTKKTASLSVGDNPTMTPGSLENASVTTWARIIDNTKMMGDERAAHGEELRMQVAEQIKSLGFKWEDYRKQCENLNTRLVEDREQTYANLKSVQKKYFDQCGHVEKERLKASNGGSAKHNRQLQSNMADMNNMKNSYIITINASNAHKAKYYHEDIPELLDVFQDINEIRIQKLNMIWDKATQLEQACLIRQGGHLGASREAIARNQPSLDTGMFLQHNTAQFNEPPPFQFEPCPIWHDTADLVVDDNSKVYLQNALAKSRRELTQLTTSVTNKQREIEGLRKSKSACAADSSRGNVEDIIMNLIRSKIDVATEDTKKNRLTTEVATITKVAGDIDRGMTEHVFKSASFTIPTTCDFCGSTIWGMSRKGYHCKACSYNCHKHCQMKVPANCTQEKGNKKTAEPNSDGSILARTSTTGSTADSVYGVGSRPPPVSDSDSDSDAVSDNSSPRAPAAARQSAGPVRRTLAPPPTSGFANGSTVAAGTEALYAYDASTSAELSIKGGEKVTVLEGDDGSGWITVKSSSGQGLVPATYVKNPVVVASAAQAAVRPTPGRQDSGASIASSTRQSTGRQGPAVAPKRSSVKKQRQVRALYNYDSTGPSELSIVEGDLITLTLEDQGDGWSTGELNGRSGIFPTAYVE